MNADARETADRLAALHARIAQAAARSGRRPEDVTLVGVAKRQPLTVVTAALRAGLRDVGESYAQEAIARLPELEKALAAEGIAKPHVHFVGRLQRNKARSIAGHVDCVHSVDRPDLATELDRRAGAAGRTLDVLLQVDLRGEPQKGGARPDALPALLQAVAPLTQLKVTGLMTLPPAGPDPESARPVFAELRGLRDSLRDEPGGDALHDLSMGMTADFEIAVEEGATIVRIGTALFGPRPESRA